MAPLYIHGGRLHRNLTSTVVSGNDQLLKKVETENQVREHVHCQCNAHVGAALVNGQNVQSHISES